MRFTMPAIHLVSILKSAVFAIALFMVLASCSPVPEVNSKWQLPEDYYSQHRSEWQELAALEGKCGGLFNLCWYVDPVTKEKIFPQKEFEIITYFNEGLAAIRLDGRYGYIGGDGEIAIEPQYDLAGPFIGGLAEIVVSGKAGLIDRDGNIVLEPNFLRATNFLNGVVIVEEIPEPVLGQPWPPKAGSGHIPYIPYQFRSYERRLYRAGFYKLDEGFLSDNRYDFRFLKAGENLQDLETGLVWASEQTDVTDNVFGIMGVDERWKLEPSFSGSWRSKNGFMRVSGIGGGQGVVDLEGDIIVPVQDIKIQDYENGYFIAENNGRFGLIDADGTLIGGRYFDQVDRGNSRWRPRVKEGGTWLQVTSDNRLIADERSGEWQLQCPGGLSVKFVDDGVQFIQSDGSVVADIVFDMRYYSIADCQYPFSVSREEDFGRITLDGRYLKHFSKEHRNEVWLDRAGRPIYRKGDWHLVSEREERVDRAKGLSCPGGSKRVKVDGKWGLAGPDGEMLVPAEHRALTCFQRGIVMAPYEDKEMWCQIGVDGLFLEQRPCLQQVYPYRLSHHKPENFAGEPFENSVRWFSAFLDHLNGERELAPKMLPSDVQAAISYSVMPGYEVP